MSAAAVVFTFGNGWGPLSTHSLAVGRCSQIPRPDKLAATGASPARAISRGGFEGRQRRRTEAKGENTVYKRRKAVHERGFSVQGNVRKVTETQFEECTSRQKPTTMTIPARPWRFDLNPGPGEARTSLARPLGFNPGALIEVNSSHIVYSYNTAVVFCSLSSTPVPYVPKAKLGKQAFSTSAAPLCLCGAGFVVGSRPVQ